MKTEGLTRYDLCGQFKAYSNEMKIIVSDDWIALRLFQIHLLLEKVRISKRSDDDIFLGEDSTTCFPLYCLNY